MKTMKYLLLIICVSCATTLMAADYVVCAAASAPTATFQSTSTMSLSGSSLPCAAVDMIIDDGMSNAENTAPRGPQRVSPDRPPEDPFNDPIGDAVLPLLLMAAGYAICAWRRSKLVRTPDSGRQR